MRVFFIAFFFVFLAGGALSSPARAGTTGGLSGVITAEDEKRTPIAGATVSLSAPSQSAVTKTDAGGHFAFVSLAPDTYVLAIEAPGYRSFSQSGLTVTADSFARVTFSLARELRQIGSVKARGNESIVQPGKTGDVYTVSGQLVQNAQGLGGGGALFQTYAAMATVPGVYVPQNGLNQGQNNSAPYIRGGNFTQVGYEYDGVPIQRAFDSYVGNTQGITGQQELQVYTGGGSASAPSESLAGYVNQVIKSGSYPSTADFEGVVGTPTFYNYLRAEVSGATTNHNFTYYLGSTAWNQDYRYADNFNGGSGVSPVVAAQAPIISGGPFSGGAPTGAVFNIPYAAGSAAGPSDTETRETVGNFHFAIPHHNGDGGSDDIQLLGQIGRQVVHVYDSINDLGGLSSPFWKYTTGGTQPTYPAAEVYTGPIFSAYNPKLATTYLYPSASFNPNQSPLDTPIPFTLRGSEDSNNSLFKIQYQKNFGSDAYARVYAYSNYSSWFVDDPIGANYLPLPESGVLGLIDDELDTHTRGVALQFADQLGSRNLLQGFASYTYAGSDRSYSNTSYDSGFTIQLRNPGGGCYNVTTGAPANCYNGNGFASGSSINVSTPGQAPQNLVVPSGAPANAQYEVVASGFNTLDSTVAPKFSTISADDNWQATNKLLIDVGVRYDRYLYGLADTSQQLIVGGSNAPSFTQYNAEHCYDAATLTLTTVAPNAACPAGVHTNLSNSYPGSFGSTVVEPRLSGTYTFDPNDVLRFSAGTYSQPTRAAYIQYNNSTDLASYTASHFLVYGYNTPAHDIPPQISNNYDLSFEKQFSGIPLALSFTPFYRLTENQTQAFVLNPTSSFQSGLNVGTLRAFGYELLARYGSFDRDGFSGQVSFAYTNTKIRYNNFAGTNDNAIDLINGQINAGAYNKLTKAGGGAACYSATGGAVAAVGGTCPASSLTNPYYDAPLAPTAPLQQNGWYSPYNLIPTSNGVDIAFGYNSVSYDVPEVLTALVQYRKHGWRFVPNLQYDTGFRYSSPFAWTGYDPSSGCTAADTTKCATIFRPDPYTGGYDGLGTFASPSTLTLGLQAAKDISKGVTLTAIVTNLYQHCYTHGYAWETGGPHACAYTLNPPQNSGGPYLGNAKNANVNSPLENDPYGYAPQNTSFPLGVFISLQVKV